MTWSVFATLIFPLPEVSCTCWPRSYCFLQSSSPTAIRTVSRLCSPTGYCFLLFFISPYNISFSIPLFVVLSLFFVLCLARCLSSILMFAHSLTDSRYGSRAMALCGEALAVPSLLWLGILPSDVDRITRSGIKVSMLEQAHWLSKNSCSIL